MAGVSEKEAEKIADQCFGDEEVTPSERARAVSCIQKTGKDKVAHDWLAANLADLCNKATQVSVHVCVHTLMPIGACLPLCLVAIPVAVPIDSYPHSCLHSCHAVHTIVASTYTRPLFMPLFLALPLQGGKDVHVIDAGCNSIVMVPYFLNHLTEDAKKKTSIMCTTNEWPGGLAALLIGVYANTRSWQDYERELKIGKCGPLVKPGGLVVVNAILPSSSSMSLHSPGRLDGASQTATSGEPTEGNLRAGQPRRSSEVFTMQ